MDKNIKIDVHYITRVEGHGNIKVSATDGKIQEISWIVPEAPRFFEAMVRGHSYEDIQTIVSRICGICSISHSFTAIKAVENALNIEVSKQTDMLRQLLHYSEQFQSHTLHIGYLAAPDFFGAPSVVPLVPKATDAVKTIIRAHRVANEWSDLLGGRTTHPITIIPGGFTTIPTEKQLRTLQDTIRNTQKDINTIAEVVLSVAKNIPNFERDTEYVSIKQTNPPEYTFYHGDIASTDDGKLVPVKNWHKVTNEYVVDQSTAKWTKWHRDSFMVGALARFNNNYDLLTDNAKKTAQQFGLKKGCCNPYMNTIAQVVECVHICEAAIGLIDKILTKGLVSEKVKVKVRSGKGAGVTEAPRGMLIHEYEFDKNGKCLAADMCIPTNCKSLSPKLSARDRMPSARNSKCSSGLTTPASPVRRICSMSNLSDKTK
jgi:coenzyme F420-reducing hydrogenase alpha subunit